MNFLIQNGVVQEKKKEFKHNLNENKRWKSHLIFFKVTVHSSIQLNFLDQLHGQYE
jgi:hypothetical protein